ncbi:MarR family transcriptional regulator [Frankia sp. AgPm24]|uniref:MarR family winged helix-turn-helix transcriptional regulator n=1 Tax=Frankia sp. AgPm24 TaxID=631128 RepID=UPI00200D20BE|nr:MarR family transcriptional regulator [Frankia sp. AgPm24]MCK9921483.1 MarR family transcriptional regulator [Frankia sp. AgPm24]
MSDAAITSGPIVLLTRLARLVHRASTPELLGISLKDLGALAFLRDHARTTQQALAEGLCVDANYCVLMLNDLETAGLIERRRDPADRRRHLVAMTEAGRIALEHAEHAQESIEDEVLAGLDPAERDALTGLLRRALDGAGRRTTTPEHVSRA